MSKNLTDRSDGTPEILLADEGEDRKPAAVEVEVVDLCGLDGDAVVDTSTAAAHQSNDDDEEIQVSSVANNQKNEDDDEIQVSAVVAAPKPSRKRQRRQGTQPSSAEAVDLVDPNQAEDTTSDAAIYKQTLGPLRMEFVDAFATRHSFEKESEKSSRVLVSNLYRELVEYQINLPIELTSSVFCRALESRLHLVRAMITGPEGTPYANGCFMFDIFLNDYPNAAPKVKFLTTGQGQARFNPNLYACGKVCLSLLGTWNGPGWLPNKSTLLQVLVSIQGLILVSDPYFNEPGYERSRGKPSGDTKSNAYNRNIRKYTIKHAILEPLNQILKNDNVTVSGGRRSKKQKAAPRKSLYPEFETVMERHFVQRSDAIQEQLTQWHADDHSLGPLTASVAQLLNTLVENHKDKTARESDATAAAAAQAPSTSDEVVTIE